jgi:guanylate kinase
MTVCLLMRSILDTTRKPRPGEVDGKDYHFVEKDDMIKEVEAGKFIESATFSGNMYGKVIWISYWVFTNLYSCAHVNVKIRYFYQSS